MRTWMKALSEHYEFSRSNFPERRMIIVFDIDGTILDMRYIIRHALKTFDLANGTNYFDALEWSEIDFHEEEIDLILDRHHIPEVHRVDIKDQYWNLLLSSASTIEAHRPFQGVLDVIRWFQLQPNTFVGLNTGRPESLRRDTLNSLNELGKRFGVTFSNELLFMRPDGCEYEVREMKAAGIQYFRELGFRVFAFIDNEPENLQAVSEIDPDNEIHLLHADTIFKSTRTAVPERAVRGRYYDVEELAPRQQPLRHIQLVWQCNYSRKSLAVFIGSNIHWIEFNLNQALKSQHERDGDLSLFECLDFIATADKFVKFNVDESTLIFERAFEIAALYGFTDNALWFKLGDVHVLRENGLKRLQDVYPKAIVEYDIDFLARTILNEPDEALEMLTILRNMGIDRFSLTRGKPAWRRIAGDVAKWGFDVHINTITSFNNFLQAALFTPRSMTLNFGFDGWRYFGSIESEGRDIDSLMKLTA